MKTILSLFIGLLLGAGVTYVSLKPKGKDVSQSLVQKLSDGTVILEYTGGVITAKDVAERILPRFEKTRDELLQAYIREAEGVLVERMKDRLPQEELEVTEAELANYLKANRIEASRSEEIRKFLRAEKERIQKQLGTIKLLQDLNVKNKLGAAFFEIQKSSKNPSKGPSSAQVNIQVFCDFGNPICNRTRLNMEALLNEQSEKISWTFRHFPVPSNRMGELAALVAICAHEQNQFWPVHDALLNNQNVLSEENILRVAVKAGANEEQLKTCLQKEETQKFLQSEIRLAQNLGLNQTPVFFINGAKVSDPEQVRPTALGILAQ
jgi:protein-disulfide isomerase